MTALLWLGLFLLSMSWNFFSPYFGMQSPKWGVCTFASGALALLFWAARVVQTPTGMLSAGLSKLRRRVARSLIVGLILTILLIVVVIAQAALVEAYPAVHARCPRLAPVSHLTSVLVSLFGLKAYVGDGTLFVKNPEYLLEFVPEMGKIGVLPWLSFMVAATIAIVLLRSKGMGRSLIYAWAGGSLYLLVRYCTLIVIYTSLDKVLKTSTLAIFWNPVYVSVSFLPLALVVGVCVRSTDYSWRFPILADLKPTRTVWSGAVMLFLGTCAYATSWAFRDPGVPKQGRILFDDSYSGEWEQASRRFDKEWYGDLSVYNYSSLAQWMKHYYQIDINEAQPLTRKLIENYDVLVIKTPTKRFSRQEVHDIIEFVHDGGGLFVMGDHTNLMGMNTFANEIIEPMGLRLKYDGVNGLNGGFSLFERPCLNPHPAVAKVEYYEFLTSCSIDAPLWAEDVMLVHSNLSDRLDYASGSFFGDFAKSPDIDFGPLLLSAAVAYGKGRLIVFSDSTTFNTFTLFMHGHAEFFKGAMQYLNRSNSRWVVLRAPLLFLGAATIMLGGVTCCVGRRRWISALTGSIAVLAGWWIAQAACGGLAAKAYPDLVEKDPIVRVHFLWAKSRYGLPPAVGSSEIPAEYAMDTFYVTVQRIGFVPSLKRTVQDLVQDADVAVILNPAEHFEKSELRLVTDWVRAGGRLLLMDNASDLHLHRSHLTDFLEPLGITLHIDSHPHFHNVAHVHCPDAKLAVFVSTFGQGRVVVVLDSARFSRKEMGHSFEKPGREEMLIYKSQFRIFEDILDPRR